MFRSRIFFLMLFLICCRVCDAQSLKVMTYNIHHANPPSLKSQIDLDAIVKAIKAQDPDLVALQEVDVNTIRSGNRNQAEEIAKKLGMQFFFGKAIDYNGGDYGVAILSRHPISEPTIHRLPTLEGSNGELRVLLTAKVNLKKGRSFIFGSTHLDAQSAPVNRQMQIKEINRIAGVQTLPFILAGDFNDVPGSVAIDELDKQFSRSCVVCDPTFPVINAQKTIDFIAFKPKSAFKIISSDVVLETYASDHLPVVSLLKIRRK